jgi:6-phosphogluconate dehydrogenase (decarboxylating)
VKVGIIGLGRMGMNMTRRLLKGGHQVVAYNRTPDRTKEIADAFSDKVLAALRQEFGGHAVLKVGQKKPRGG